jgi:hypothetical protein
MPFIPTYITKEVNFYKINGNMKGNTQEDIKMYTNYLKSLEGCSKTKTDSPKLMVSHSKAKIDLF